MTEARWKLPETWGWATADDIASIVGGGTPSTRNSDNFSERGIPWVTPADLTGYRQTYIARGARDLSSQGYASSGAQLIPQGSVLFSSRAPIGYCAVAANEMATNQGFKSLVLRGGIVPEYIRYYLLSAKEYAESLSSGTTFRELSGARMAKLSIPVAPTTEQRRIVAKLDGLLGRAARARKELDHVPVLLNGYKQAILASAFSGRLTEDFRNSSDCGPWSTEMTLGELVTEGPTNGWSPPSAPEAQGALSLKLTATTSGVLRLDSAAVKRIREVPPLSSRYWLRSGDLLIQRSNSIEHVGASAIFDGPAHTYIFPDLMMRVRFEDSTTTKFMWRYLNSDVARAYLRERATGTAGNMPKINGTVVRSLPVPLPSPPEIAEIVRRIESAFAWLDKLAAEHTRAAALLPKLEQALLAKAFRGELVPQDQNDEPASALLERIRAARAAAPERQRKPRSSNLPRAPRQRATMTKSRLDQDVMHQPYLAKHLRDAGGSAKVEDLFRSADLPVTDFYKQLAWEVEAGHVNDQGALLEAA